MDMSQLQFIDHSVLDACVDFIKCYDSGSMVEEMYAPQKKNKLKKTKWNEIYDSVAVKIQKIVLNKLKKEQLRKHLAKKRAAHVISKIFSS